MGIAPCLPGFLRQLCSWPDVGGVWDNFYQISWFAALIISGTTYFILFSMFPTAVCRETYEDQLLLEGQGDSQEESLLSEHARGYDRSRAESINFEKF